MDEIWKPIRGCEEYYSVSNLGRVMRTSSKNGGKPGKVVQPFHQQGYVRYNLYISGKILKKMAHILVYEAFISPVDPSLETNHKNGIRSDNRPENLELVSGSQNVRHAFDVLGKKPSAHRAKLTWEQAQEIRRIYAEGNSSYSKLAKQFCIDQSCIGDIVKSKNYRDPNLKNRGNYSSPKRSGI